MQAAELASRSDGDAVAGLLENLRDAESAVRYWGAIGFLVRGSTAVSAGQRVLAQALDDTSPYVRVVAAETLARYGEPADRERAIALLASLANCEKNGVFPAMAALNALGAVGKMPTELPDSLKSLPTKCPLPDARYSEYIGALLGDL